MLHQRIGVGVLNGITAVADADALRRVGGSGIGVLMSDLIL